MKQLCWQASGPRPFKPLLPEAALVGPAGGGGGGGAGRLLLLQQNWLRVCSAGAGELCQWERRRFLFARSTPSIAQTVQICFSLLPFNIQIVLGWIGFFLDCRIQILKKQFGF